MAGSSAAMRDSRRAPAHLGLAPLLVQLIRIYRVTTTPLNIRIGALPSSVGVSPSLSIESLTR